MIALSNALQKSLQDSRSIIPITISLSHHSQMCLMGQHKWLCGEYL